MLCPICKTDRMLQAENRFLDCPNCGLHRRPNDKIWLCEETNFYILGRNIVRSPSGTRVEIIETNHGLKGIYGQLKSEGPSFALRSKSGFIIGLSRDKDDLILLIAEYDWCIEDPEIGSIVDGIKHDNPTRDTSGCS